MACPTWQPVLDTQHPDDSVELVFSIVPRKSESCCEVSLARTRSHNSGCVIAFITFVAFVAFVDASSARRPTLIPLTYLFLERRQSNWVTLYTRGKMSRE